MVNGNRWKHESGNRGPERRSTVAGDDPRPGEQAGEPNSRFLV